MLNMRTIGYAVPKKTVLDLIKTIDKDMPELIKHEDGTPSHYDGHCVTYKLNGTVVFFAMIHSNKKVYLLRADKDLVAYE